MTTELINVAFDTETDLIGPCNLAPKVVCLTSAMSNGQGGYDTDIQAVADTQDFDSLIDSMFYTDGLRLIGCNTKYDLRVLIRHRPDLISRVCDLLEQGAVSCIQTREKLINLVTTGEVDERHYNKQRIKYNMKVLAAHYLGLDLSADKDKEDSWRMNYNQLMETPLDQWPPEAVKYAVDDSIHTLRIWEMQEEQRQLITQERGYDPFAVEAFRVKVDFYCGLITARGIKIDAEAKAALDKKMEELLSYENIKLLIETGILSPEQPSRPQVRTSKAHKKGCPDKKNCNCPTVTKVVKDHTKECKRRGECDCPPKMTKPAKESINQTNLRQHVLKLAEQYPDDIKLKYTEPTKQFPDGQLQVNKAWLDEYAGVCPVLTQYRDRQRLQKMVTTELPRMCYKDGRTAEVVHFNFSNLKETGRTSSWGDDLYPSGNGQNIQPEARGCYVPRDGYVMFSIDYSAMELGTLAQKCLNLFGESIMADLINEGVDLHAYLGAQLALSMDTDFAEVCASEDIETGRQVYNQFLEFQTSDVKELKAFFKHFRKFAKPTGLGYPGGLGPATFLTYAKDTFGVQTDIETARELRNIWRRTFPEMVKYHNYINNKCKDQWNKRKGKPAYCYTTPYGMHRAGATFCACANGMGMQSPAAEGALTALCQIVRECYDPSCDSVLFGGTFVLNFIHDEVQGEVEWNELTMPRIQRMQYIMEMGMREITPDVEARTTACLMRRWDKAAETVLDENGQLQIWEPEPTQQKG